MAPKNLNITIISRSGCHYTAIICQLLAQLSIGYSLQADEPQSEEAIKSSVYQTTPILILKDLSTSNSVQRIEDWREVLRFCDLNFGENELSGKDPQKSAKIWEILETLDNKLLRVLMRQSQKKVESPQDLLTNLENLSLTIQSRILDIAVGVTKLALNR